jgi:hypothetical protein
MSGVVDFCPMCEGAKKWHRDGQLCNLPIVGTFGVKCQNDHTICPVCKGVGKVALEHGSLK